MEYPIVEVRRNKSNGQKLLTVPKDSDIHPDDKVMMLNLGKHWDAIPGYLKTHHQINELVTLCIKSTDYLGDELEEFYPHMEDAGEALSRALDVIEENRAVYADVSTEELQESCRHDKIERNGEGWECVNCKKKIALAL